VDRIYLGVPRQLTVVQTATGTCCELDTSPELTDAVVWNPWADKVRGKETRRRLRGREKKKKRVAAVDATLLRRLQAEL
jgi:hypothetical protein